MATTTKKETTEEVVKETKPVETKSTKPDNVDEKLEKLTDNAAMKRVADKVAFHKEAGNIVDHAEEAQKARQDAVMQHVADKEDVYDRLNTGRGEGTTKSSRQDQVMQRINEKEALYRRLAGK